MLPGAAQKPAKTEAEEKCSCSYLEGLGLLGADADFGDSVIPGRD